jgi:hypothetical protein
LSEDAFEYKPEIPVVQSQQDIARKYRFDKLGGFAKRRRLSDDHALHLKQVPIVEHIDILPKDTATEVKYGKVWLQRYGISLTWLSIGNARNLLLDLKRSMTLSI